MNGIEKTAKIVERLRQIEVLAEPRPYASQLESWAGADLWADDTIAEISELVDMIDTLLLETEDGD